MEFPHQGEPALPVRRRRQLIGFAPEDFGAGVEHDLLVVHDQDAGGIRHGFRSSAAACTGRRIVNMAPRPSPPSTVIVPPCSFTIP